MIRWTLRSLLALLLLAAIATLGVWWLVRHQGASASEWKNYPVAQVRFDARGIPTIEAPVWSMVIEAEGFVVASDRFFHMDLLRRAAGGRLSELFGPDAIPVDEKRRKEDWLGTADRAYAALPPEERAFLDTYARGVNDFLRSHRGRAGVEYLLLRTEPEPWQPRDSLLVLLLMCEQLATSAPTDALSSAWKSRLSPEWFQFLFTTDHPWNQPMFGTKPRERPALPAAALPAAPIVPAAPPKTGSLLDPDPVQTALASLGLTSGFEGASNNWGWCKGESCFLVNDPHLSASVPHLWYLVRLRVAADDWVVGVSLPGIPGVTLGMNPHLAWAFTNVGEDVDDYLKEELSPDGKRYVLSITNGEKVWADVVEENETIKVRDGQPKEVTRRRTTRGPLAPRTHLDGEYSRLWLPLVDGALHFPVGLNFAKSWEELNRALDVMRVPAQNVLMIDRAGRLGYRASGTGIDRKVSGRFPLPALEGEWRGFLPPETRPRMLFYPKSETSSTARYLATANERIWVDDGGHMWAQDLRKDRIRRFLESEETFTQADMQKLQLDTQSRAHQLLLHWISERAEPKTGGLGRMLEHWRHWDGVAQTDPETFTQALEAQDLIYALCLERVRAHLLSDADKELPYEWRLQSAWMITALEAKDGLAVFGLDEKEVAQHIAERVLESAPQRVLYHHKNRWKAQHPLAKLPVIGSYFAIDEPQQYGSYTVPRVEAPKYGASTRLIWNLAHPEQSTWITPVGQSGHIGSAHFHDLQARWHSGRPLPVFDDRHEWRSSTPNP